jgi:hypothetical protein
LPSCRVTELPQPSCRVDTVAELPSYRGLPHLRVAELPS